MIKKFLIGVLFTILSLSLVSGPMAIPREQVQQKVEKAFKDAIVKDGPAWKSWEEGLAKDANLKPQSLDAKVEVFEIIEDLTVNFDDKDRIVTQAAIKLTFIGTATNNIGGSVRFSKQAYMYALIDQETGEIFIQIVSTGELDLVPIKIT